MLFRSSTWFFFTRKNLLFGLALLPAIFLLVDVANDALGANPVETLTRTTGDWAFRFLLITLAMTPLRHLTGSARWLQLRRMFGLFTFFYACLHFSIYVADQLFSVETVWQDVVERPYITVGFTAFLMLWPLALTSTRAMMRRLGKRWSQLHQLVYVIAVLGLLHYFWLIKSGYLQAVIYLLLLAILLGFRIRRRFS